MFPVFMEGIRLGICPAFSAIPSNIVVFIPVPSAPCECYPKNVIQAPGEQRGPILHRDLAKWKDSDPGFATLGINKGK